MMNTVLSVAITAVSLPLLAYWLVSTIALMRDIQPKPKTRGPLLASVSISL